ncbi:MAG TPA: glycine betaine ABC transporter substrate-binding protein [Desulfobacterales bacterium]|nr:glycine betaine ABC transporter substrate-binding protein [Desulfobacterales bacterium]
MGAEHLISYVAERLPELWLRTGEHLMLTGCSTLAAMFIGVPVGILIFRTTWLRGPVMGVIGILQTIPSLAMLVFLLALLKKIGVLPAIIALIIYALLPIARNTLTGLEEVSAEVMEAAEGIGMQEYQQLMMVRIPLATPVIVAGIRTAAVVGVGIATLSAFIGAGGLGQFINRGLALSNTKLILLGAIPAALLALVVDFSIGAFEWGLRPERKRDKKGSVQSLMRPLAFMLPVAIILTSMVTYFTKPGWVFESATRLETGHRIIRIATKNFTEQLILGEMMAQLIEAKANFMVERRFNLGGTMICHGALVNGEIDLYAEYTGTGLTAILKHEVITDPEEALYHVTKAYHERFDLQWLEPFGFNNTYAITVRAADAAQNGWNTISDLVESAHNLFAGFTAEFAERPDGYPGLRQTYTLQFGEVRDFDPSLMYEAIRKKEVDVICAFATDGRIAKYNLKPLKDDRNFFPPYHAAPVIRTDILKKNPELADVLKLLGGIIDDATMQRLNFEVDAKQRKIAKVVEEFLRAKEIL